MKILKPVGQELEFDGKVRHLLFNVNVIDEIQEKYDTDVVDVLNTIFETQDKEKKKKAHSTLAYVLTVLINEDVRMHNKKNEEDRWEEITEDYIRAELLTNSTSRDLSTLVLQSFNGTLPKPDKVSPNEMSE